MVNEFDEKLHRGEGDGQGGTDFQGRRCDLTNQSGALQFTATVVLSCHYSGLNIPFAK